MRKTFLIAFLFVLTALGCSGEAETTVTPGPTTSADPVPTSPSTSSTMGSPDAGPARPPLGPTQEPFAVCEEGDCANFRAMLTEAVIDAVANCEALESDEILAEAAQAHAQRQADQGQLLIDGPDGALDGQIRAADERFNDGIYLVGTTITRRTEALIEEWQGDSYGAGVLAQCTRWVGVGVAEGENGTTYAAVFFAKE